MKYTHLLLDADNTLFDFNKSEAVALTRMLESHGVRPTAEQLTLYHTINDKWWAKFEKAECTMAELSAGRFEDFAAAIGLECRDAEELSTEYRGYLGQCRFLMDGVLDAVRRLADDYKLYIITNGIADVQHPRFDHSELEPYISGIFVSEEIGCSKPSRRYFRRVRRKIGRVPKRKMLVVGDSLRSDILGGRNAGIDTCWVSHGAEDTGSIKPTYTVPTFDRIFNVLK